MRSPLLFAAVLLATAALAAPASADALEYSAGVKLSAGGAYWSSPSNPPPGQDFGFVGEGGGFAYGGGGYFEIRAAKIVGLELGLGYDKLTIQRKVTLNKVVDTHEKLTASSLRVPLLAKLILPLGLGRLSVGIGPDFLIPLSAEGAVTRDDGLPLIGSNATGSIGVSEQAKSKSSMLLTGELGLTIEIPAIGIDIPIALRASKNLSQEDAWAGRVATTAIVNGGAFQEYTAQAQPSIDARLVAGVGYRF